MQDADQLPKTSKDAIGADSASAEVNVSKLVLIKCHFENYYSYNLQGASDGVASRRKVVKSWNTLVNEDEENHA